MPSGVGGRVLFMGTKYVNLIPRITRALHSAAVSLHIYGLRTSVNASTRRFTGVQRRTDDANTAERVARSNRVIATTNEREASKAHAGLITAAQAEARSLRRDASVV